MCNTPPTTESHHKKRGLSILITYMEHFFAAKTAVCETNIIIWPDYSCMEKGTNSAASCVGSVNNSAGGVSTRLSPMLFSLVGAAAHMVTDNENQRQMETRETLRRLIQHIQTVSKTFLQ